MFLGVTEVSLSTSPFYVWTNRQIMSTPNFLKDIGNFQASKIAFKVFGIPRIYAAKLIELLRATIEITLVFPFIDFAILRYNYLHATYS